MKKTVLLSLILLSQAARAQWAVLDEQVRIIVDNINNVRGNTGQMDNLPATSNLDVDFSTVAVQNPERFIGTVADCGDRLLNQNHYNACMGLRNLRLTTLKETVDLVNVIVRRDGQIKRLIDDGITVADSGKLQRLQFEFIGLQTHMQNDAMKLQALRFGYKQREKADKMQMAEARNVPGTRSSTACAVRAICAMV
ncbi:hypothetical protein [Hydrogenophaga flava]|uniref:hypothetical protein n=1 Tax=Hydrogenophaga flava TaxID=65657 RepID=UPI0008266528|nr:hypothetical protein [Hydrogenophaga flava]